MFVGLFIGDVIHRELLWIIVVYPHYWLHFRLLGNGNLETGNPRFSHSVWGFPVKFPLNQFIDNWGGYPYFRKPPYGGYEFYGDRTSSTRKWRDLGNRLLYIHYSYGSLYRYLEKDGKSMLTSLNTKMADRGPINGTAQPFQMVRSWPLCRALNQTALHKTQYIKKENMCHNWVLCNILNHISYQLVS